MKIVNLFTKLALLFIVTLGIFYVSLGFSHRAIPALEIIEFHTNEGVTTEQVSDASQKFTSDLKKYPGFLGRTLTQDSEDLSLWTDIIEWNSVDEGISAMKSEINKDNMKNFIALMKKGHKRFETGQSIDVSYLNIKSQD
ncbi:hypothetical protein FLM55_01105 [Francisella sp. Scap27]|uniref:hypothetical protein n=1 Tax=Francisella sp. Scap27 TaxID=2589986 RepID=UPI0015BDDB76|nr:hypothetical protein [Francisella sp. Scap27]QLE78410.1 hypothetical protein FLM55_01105 [Francisella sp. Scap27]